MSLNEDLTGRLENWKFESAKMYVDFDVSVDERLVIEALADTYGNCGWFEGSMGLIIGAAVEALIGGLIERTI